MKNHIVYILIIVPALYAGTICTAEKSGYPAAAVPVTAVKLTDNFWRGRIETNRTVTIPYGFKKCEQNGRMRNFERAGGLLEGEYEGKMPFDDSDVYKIIEGASYSLAVQPDKELEKYIGGIIEKIAEAQEGDGYLCTWKTLNPEMSPAPWVSAGPRWHNLGASHELYNMGHLYEAAYAHYISTGKKTLLNVALKNADLIAEVFGPGKKLDVPGHQIIETGLVKLYLATGNEKYLKLARFFLDQRGNSAGHGLHGPYSQDHQPVTEQTEAVGHAVRAVYMYAAMTDIAAVMNDAAYKTAAERIWDNVVSKKMYITGGLGARHEQESFGDDYELPNLTAYSETCSAIGSVYWNHRMFLLTGESKYIDVLERTLYNGLISGVSLEGNKFFYPNPLESDGKYEFNMGSLTRQKWFDCSCCPTNVSRFIPTVPGYIYAVKDNSLYVNLFIAGSAEVTVDKTKVNVTQQTNYPWDGDIKIKIEPEKEKNFTVYVRLPGWARGEVVPSDLYNYIDKNPAEISLNINGKPMGTKTYNGFAAIERKWSRGDTIELELPTSVRLVVANEKVKDDAGKVAIERGPIVYCVEGIDNDANVLDLTIADDVKFQTEYKKDLLNGVTVITAEVTDKSGEKRKLTAVPYYAWSHRGPGHMAVWLLREQQVD